MSYAWKLSQISEIYYLPVLHSNNQRANIIKESCDVSNSKSQLSPCKDRTLEFLQILFKVPKYLTATISMQHMKPLHLWMVLGMHLTLSSCQNITAKSQLWQNYFQGFNRLQYSTLYKIQDFHGSENNRQELWCQ